MEMQYVFFGVPLMIAAGFAALATFALVVADYMLHGVREHHKIAATIGVACYLMLAESWKHQRVTVTVDESGHPTYVAAPSK